MDWRKSLGLMLPTETVSAAVADGYRTKRDETERYADTNWVLVKRTDVAAVTAWMDQYCAAHPLERIVDAAGKLANELFTVPQRKTT